jgi:hypothetical protein
LMRYQAYRTGQSEIVVTVSQLYPVSEVAAFEVAPHSRTALIRREEAPVVPWTEDDLGELAEAANVTTLAILDLCAASPSEWIPASEVYERAGVTVASGTGQLGGFGLTVRARFGRSNPPYDREWGAGGGTQAYYTMDPELAAAWLSVRGQSAEEAQASLPAQEPEPEGTA